MTILLSEEKHVSAMGGEECESTSTVLFSLSRVQHAQKSRSRGRNRSQTVTNPQTVSRGALLSVHRDEITWPQFSKVLLGHVFCSMRGEKSVLAVEFLVSAQFPAKPFLLPLTGAFTFHAQALLYL